MKFRSYIAFLAGIIPAAAVGAALLCWTTIDAVKLLAVSIGFVYPCGMATFLAWLDRLDKKRVERKERWANVNTGVYRSGEDVIIPLEDIRRARRKVIRRHGHFGSRYAANIEAEILDEIGAWRC